MDITGLTTDYLSSIFNYDPVTGITFWKTRPRTDFRYSTRHKAWNHKYSDTQVGKIDPSTNKLRVSMFQRTWLMDQLIYKMLYNVDAAIVNHINRCNADSSQANLTTDTTHRPTKYEGGDLYLTKDIHESYCIASGSAHYLQPPIVPNPHIHIFNFYRERRLAKTEMLELCEKLQAGWSDFDA